MSTAILQRTVAQTVLSLSDFKWSSAQRVSIRLALML